MSSQSFAKQSTFVSIAHIAAITGTLLAQIIISRTFGPEGRGVFANTFALAGFLILLIGTGHETANTYFVASGKQKVSEAAGSSLLGLMISMAILSVVTFLIVRFRPSFVAISSNRVIILAISFVPFTWAALYVYGLVRGIGRADLAYLHYPIVNLTWMATLACFCYGFAFRQLEIVFITHLIAMAVSLVAALWLLVRLSGFLRLTFSWKTFKQSMFYGIKHLIGKIANPMMVRFDMLILPMLYVAKGDLGIYAQGLGILDRILMLPLIIGYVLMPRVSKDPEKSVNMTASLCRLSLWITFILGLTIMLFAKPLISFLFKPEFVPAVPLMWIIFPGIILRSVPHVLRNYFRGIGEPGKVSAVFAVSFVTMVVADVLLVPRLGIRGAAIGVLLACLVEFGAIVYLFRRKVGMGVREVCLVRISDVMTVKDRVLSLLSRKARS